MSVQQQTRSSYCGKTNPFDYKSHFEKYAFKSTSSNTMNSRRECIFSPGEACWLPHNDGSLPNNTDTYPLLLCDVVAIMPTVGGNMVLLVARETGVHQPPPSEWCDHQYGSAIPSRLLYAYEARLMPCAGHAAEESYVYTKTE